MVRVSGYTSGGPGFDSPMWSSRQSSWLQIQSPEFDYRALQEKEVVGVERGPLSLVSTVEELTE
jgi:hypothetical protein